ncbi:hypothetical protein LTS17_003721 [Exophiala oligosperma]
MDETYSKLAADIHAAARAKAPGRLIVGIAGPPGCGKSTIAATVVSLINNNNRKEPPPDAAAAARCRAQTIPLDGFHYTRQYLDSLPNRKEAYIRRGAPWTFDVDAMVAFIKRLADSARLPPSDRPTILAPSFDHAEKDPRNDDIGIPPETSIIVLDGNYLLLDEDQWRDIHAYLDLKIFVDVEPCLARERVARRHVAAGIEPTLEKGQMRFDTNDAINGDLIRNKIVKYDLMIESVTVR